MTTNELATKAIGLTEEYTKKQIFFNVPNNIVQSKWAVHAGGSIWMAGPLTADSLPAGIYNTGSNMQSSYLETVEFKTDTLIPLSDDPSSEVMDHIKDFWTKESKFREFGFTYKRGILLYGPPGGGKSSTIFQLSAEFVRENGIVLLVDYPGDCAGCLNMIKNLEPGRKIIVIMEDIDTIIQYYGDRKLTHLLDGGADVDGVVFVATTNYPERLPARLLNRPSRFDIVKYIGMPSEAARRDYINALINNLVVDTEQLVMATEGLGIAQIKEVILLTQVFDQTIDEAVSNVKNIGRNLISE